MRISLRVRRKPERVDLDTGTGTRRESIFKALQPEGFGRCISGQRREGAGDAFSGGLCRTEEAGREQVEAGRDGRRLGTRK